MKIGARIKQGRGHFLFNGLEDFLFRVLGSFQVRCYHHCFGFGIREYYALLSVVRFCFALCIMWFV
jgi:hypothetical protein